MIDNIEAIIFDMDGLMFDTETISRKSWEKAFDACGYNLTQEIFLKTLGTNRERTKEIFIKSYGVNFSNILERLVCY